MLRRKVNTVYHFAIRPMERRRFRFAMIVVIAVAAVCIAFGIFRRHTRAGMSVSRRDLEMNAFVTNLVIEAQKSGRFPDAGQVTRRNQPNDSRFFVPVYSLWWVDVRDRDIVVVDLFTDDAHYVRVADKSGAIRVETTQQVISDLANRWPSEKGRNTIPDLMIKRE